MHAGWALRSHPFATRERVGVIRSNSRLLPVFVPDVWGRPGEAFGFLFFARGDETEQIAVGLGAEGFRAVAVVMEKAASKGAPCALPVFDFQSVERGQGDAVSAIEVAQGFKDFGFELMVVRLGVTAMARG